MVVDDSTTSQNIFKEILESFSFNVTVADAGEKAITEINKYAGQETGYDLVIMDWKMPGMDGIEASRQIKKISDSSRKPKIIMATAYGRQEVMRQADEVGLDGFLIKPVNPSVMLNTIMEVFGKEVERSPRARTEKAGKEQPRNEETLGKLKGACILLVEDNEINQQVASEILKGAGIEVTLANNGQEAVQAVKQGKFDAVLMDIQMPVMDGYEATRKIREWQLKAHSSKLIDETTDHSATRDPQPETSDQRPAPIIAMTAHAMSGDREKSLEAGMVDHVAKPIDPDQLFSTLHNWIHPLSNQGSIPPATIESAGNGKGDVLQDALPEDQVKTDVDLPETLQGFDIEQGLKRMQGNRKLYRKLLLDFAANYGNAADEIHQALTADNINQVHSLVHNIKGLAGNLSATKLQNAATAMDSSVKKALSGAEQVPGDLDSIFAEMKTALEQALASCQTLAGPEDEKSDISISDEDSIGSLPPDLAHRTAERIHDAADMGSISDLKLIAEELKTESDSYAGISAKITQLAENFDFDGIIKLAGELESTTTP